MSLTLSDRPLRETLASFGQEHLLGFWDQLDADQRQSLVRQIESLDLGLIQGLARAPDSFEDIRVLAERAQSPAAVRLDGSGLPIAAQEAVAAGEAALRGGRVGAILVAGGQGTRLGFDDPKGIYPIGPVSRHSLFQIHLEKLLARGRRYGTRIPLYVMTSPATDAPTRRDSQEHDRFGAVPEDLVLFRQGTMPAVDEQTGRILLARPDEIFSSPDGHGGVVAALLRSGALAQALDRGIEQFFYFQVDNPLADLCGPEFLGYHLLSGSQMTTQVIAKTDPLEKVGNAVAIDGRMRVLEYSDLPDDVAHRRGPDGQLAIWAGSIGVHVIAADFLRRMAGRDDVLPFHRARKKVPHVNAAGEPVQPAEPNAVKFERFIFDLLPHAARAIVVEIDAWRGFAPLKNAPGAAKDSPEAVRRQMVAVHGEWLRQAGVELSEGVQAEIGPLFALDAGEVAAKVRPGTRLSADTFFGA